MISLECVSNTGGLFPSQKQLISLYPEDSVMYVAADPTELLQKPEPTSPILHLGEKQTTAISGHIQHDRATSTTNNPCTNSKSGSDTRTRTAGGGGGGGPKKEWTIG